MYAEEDPRIVPPDRTFRPDYGRIPPESIGDLAIYRACFGMLVKELLECGTFFISKQAAIESQVTSEGIDGVGDGSADENNVEITECVLESPEEIVVVENNGLEFHTAGVGRIVTIPAGQNASAVFSSNSSITVTGGVQGPYVSACSANDASGTINYAAVAMNTESATPAVQGVFVLSSDAAWVLSGNVGWTLASASPGGSQPFVEIGWGFAGAVITINTAGANITIVACTGSNTLTIVPLPPPFPSVITLS